MKGKSVEQVIEVIEYNYYGEFLNLLLTLIDDLEIAPEDIICDNEDFVELDYSNYHGDRIEFTIGANDHHVESCTSYIHDIDNPECDYNDDEDIAEFIMTKVKALRARV